MSEKITVERFLLQPTESFTDGAPQREEYESDALFLKALFKYAAEWRDKYNCGDGNCINRDCPEHHPMINLAS